MDFYGMTRNFTTSQLHNFTAKIMYLCLHKIKIMNTSIDISYYPLKVEFIPPIKEFIDRLHGHEGLTVKTNGMSTQVFGEYFEVMKAITEEIHKSFELPHSVFILKIINADLNHVVKE